MLFVVTNTMNQIDYGVYDAESSNKAIDACVSDRPEMTGSEKVDMVAMKLLTADEMNEILKQYTERFGPLAANQ